MMLNYQQQQSWLKDICCTHETAKNYYKLATAHMKVPPGYVDHTMLVNDMILTSNIHHFYAKCSNKLEFIVDVMTKMFYYNSDSKMIIFVTV